MRPLMACLLAMGCTDLRGYGVFSATVTALAFSPDGAMLATGDQGGAVRLWNVARPRNQASHCAGAAPPANPDRR